MLIFCAPVPCASFVQVFHKQQLKNVANNLNTMENTACEQQSRNASVLPEPKAPVRE